MRKNKYEELFYDRWEEMKDVIILEREDGETTFLEKDIFPKFFISPELLVGFYIYRGDHDFETGYDMFMEEYDGWIESAKSISSMAKEIFEKEYEQEMIQKHDRIRVC